MSRALATTGLTALGSPVPAPVIDERLAALVVTEGVAPLVGGRLLRGAELKCSQATERALIEAHKRCLARNLWREHLILPLVEALNRQRIDNVLLKGAALVHSAYVSPGDRDMGDTDILVDERRWKDAVEVVSKNRGDLSVRPMTARWDYAIQVDLPGGARLDLHRYLAPRPMFSPDYQEIFRESTAVAEHLRTPEKHASFVTLAIHAAKHGYVLPLRGVVDGLMLARLGLDVERVGRIARRWAARRATARWIQLLRRVGLPGSQWQGLERALLRGFSVGSRLPHHVPRSRAGTLWANEGELWQQALLSLDAPARMFWTIADRTRLRLGNQLKESAAQFLSRSAWNTGGHS